MKLKLSSMDDHRNAIYARMVKKVGSRHYWDQWAKDIADIASAHITRITALVDDPDTPPSQQFEVFPGRRRRNWNKPSTRAGAMERLARPMITSLVFEALLK